MGDWLVPTVIAGVMVFAKLRGVKVYEEFIEGAREGLHLTYRLLPYLVGMLTAVEMFKKSGALEALGKALAPLLGILRIPPEILALMVIRPVSGGAAAAMVLNILRTYGPDSTVGRMASIMQGSSDTTFYVLSLYFGSVNITKTRHALWVCLIGDMVGFASAILLTYLFFG
ncbi:MAG TPA: spore maturation protein [Firmicutes bacterium]|nr:spore maturation protein [Bacillota bacterium]